MRQASFSVIAGVLAVAGLALCAGSAQAQHRHHHHHHHQSQFGYPSFQGSYYAPSYSYALDPWQRQRYDGVCRDQRISAYPVQPYYAAPYQGSYYQSGYYAPAPNFSFGYQNRDFGIYIAR